MVDYDSKVLYKFVDRLYSKANGVVARYVLLGILMGGGIGYGIPIFLGGKESSGVIMIFLVVFGALLGYFAGEEKAFWFRLQAQTLLCQVKIEENTRKQKDG